jgi:trehalose synthase
VATGAAEFAPPPVPADRRYVCPPAVDPRAPRNLPLTPEQVDELLAEVGLSYPKRSGGGALFEQQSPLPPGARVVLHVASWDPVAKLPALLGCLPMLPPDVHLVVAGPDPRRLPAEPDGQTALDLTRAAIARLSIVDRLRVHLVLAGADPLVLNAVQRRADVVLQAGLADGAGLTVPEAMAKRRAIVLADAYGMGSQLLVADAGLRVDPAHRRTLVAALRILLDDPRLRRDLGERAASAAAGQHAMSRLVVAYAAFAAVRPAPSVGLPALFA